MSVVFIDDPALYHDAFRTTGYVHLKDVLSDDFRTYLTVFQEHSLRDRENEIGTSKIHGKKRQFLFHFADREDAGRFRSGMAALTRIDPERFTISERHLKVYDEEAPCWPAPHADRAASEISIGLPVHIPEGSTACMFPELNFGANIEERPVFLTERGHPDLEDVYRAQEPVMPNEQFGDVIVFLGSPVFLGQVPAAGAAILYITVNGDGRDPLGENIYASELA
jgi:hypothetical protein